MNGDWVPAKDRGDLYQDGWGAALGYPGILLNPHGKEINGLLFRPEDLVHNWSRLDEFEDSDYVRTKTKATLDTGEQVEAYIYALTCRT